MFCYTLLYVDSSFAKIFDGKRELVAWVSLSSWCLIIVVWLFLAVPWVCLQFVIVVIHLELYDWSVFKHNNNFKLKPFMGGLVPEGCL